MHTRLIVDFVSIWFSSLDSIHKYVSWKRFFFALTFFGALVIASTNFAFSNFEKKREKIWRRRQRYFCHQTLHCYITMPNLSNERTWKTNLLLVSHFGFHHSGVNLSVYVCSFVRTIKPQRLCALVSFVYLILSFFFDMYIISSWFDANRKSESEKKELKANL